LTQVPGVPAALQMNRTPLLSTYSSPLTWLPLVGAPGVVAAHIKLLCLNGQYEDAGKLLDRIPEFARQPLLGPLYTEVLFRTNQVDASIKQAKTATEVDPNNAQNHYWYSQLLARSAQDPKLSESQRK